MDPSTTYSTIPALSDALVAATREINDITVQLQGALSRISTNETNITSLQNPPPGVPAPLLAWLGTHSIREVDSILDTTLTGYDASIAGINASITTLTSNLSNEATARIAGDGTLQTSINDLQNQVTANLAALNQEISDRSTFTSSVGTSIDSINARIDTTNASLSSEVSSRTSATNSLSSQLATLAASMQTVNTQIALLQGIGVDPAGALASQITTLTTTANNASSATASEATTRAAADLALQNSVKAISNSITATQAAIAQEVIDRGNGDNALQASINSLSANVSSNTAAITAETAARIAADTTLTNNVATNTANIATNAAAIAQEVTDRTNAVAGVQTQVTANTGNIATNTSNIASLTTTQTLIRAKFGVIKDGGGYVTSWKVLDDSTGAGNFNLRNLNNDARLQNPGYVGNYFPPVAVSAFAPPTSFDSQYGSGSSTLFHGTDGNDYTRLANVYATANVGLNRSVFLGVNNGTGGNLNRLGQNLTTFLVNFSGYVNGQLSVWYRIKTTPSDTTQRWFSVAMAPISMPSPRTYELAVGSAVVQIAVTETQVIEFGLTNLSTLDASRSSSNTVIYNGQVSVQALNMTTIS